MHRDDLITSLISLEKCIQPYKKNTFKMFLSKRKMNQPSITFAVGYVFYQKNCVICKHFKPTQLNKNVYSYIIKYKWHIFVTVIYNVA